MGNNYLTITAIKNFETEKTKFSPLTLIIKRSDRQVIFKRTFLFVSTKVSLISTVTVERFYSFVPLTARRFREAPPPAPLPPPTFLAPLFPFVPCFHYNRLFYSFAVSRHRWNGANNRESIRLARNGPVSCPYGQSSLSSTFQRRLFRWSPRQTITFDRYYSSVTFDSLMVDK